MENINKPTNPINLGAPTNPINFDSTPAEIVKLGGKPTEEKIYLVLYNRTDEDSNGFLLCEGRMDCYTSIERLLNTYPVDIHNSIVLVEVPAVNRNGKGEWMMKHINTAPSIYQFCKSVEGMFSNIEFSIDDFNQDAVEDDNQAVTEEDIRATMSQGRMSAEDSAIAAEYKKILSENG